MFSNKNGYLYSFTGLRGDSKQLYWAVKEGREKRVQLIKCPKPSDQAKHVNEADLVIWACGYQTQPLSLKDGDRQIPLLVKVPHTQFDVDSKCHLITASN